MKSTTLEQLLDDAVPGEAYLVSRIIANLVNGKSFRGLEYTADPVDRSLVFPGRGKCSSLYKKASLAIVEFFGSRDVTGDDPEYTSSTGNIIDNDLLSAQTFEGWMEMIGVNIEYADEFDDPEEDDVEEVEAPKVEELRYTAVINQNSMVIMISDGRRFTIQDDFDQYDELKDLVSNFGDTSKVLELCDLAGQIISAFDKLHIENGKLFYKDMPVSTKMIPRILVANKVDPAYASALENFFGRLVQNPYASTVDSLYRFLSANSMPITADGFFLAFKRVREDYTDVHSGKFDNSVGQVVEVPWMKVDLDNERTCSYGLHVCSAGYLGSFGGSRVMVCKVDPADVGACPHDYNSSKLRVRKYEVIGEIENGFSMSDLENYFYHPDKEEALQDAHPVSVDDEFDN